MGRQGRVPREALAAEAGGGEAALTAARPWALAIAGLSLAGVAIAGYLSWRHAVGGPIACGGSGGCDIVNASRYAYFLGIPVAYLGLAMYATLFGLAAAQALLRRPPEWVPLALLALAAAGAGFSLYLTSMELFVIRAICRWCVASQLDILAILASAVLLVRQGSVKA